MRKQIVSEKPEPDAGETQPLPSPAIESAEAVEECARSDDPNLLSLEHLRGRIRVGFNYKDIPDEIRVGKYRAQLNDFVKCTGCKSLTFDLAGIKILPSRMIGFFVSLKNEGHDIELLDLEPAVQDIFRITKLGPMFTILRESN